MSKFQRKPRFAKVDSNQNRIVEALRKSGCSVQSLASVGDGCPDLLVSRTGCGNYLMEVKDFTKPPSKRRLTPDEAKWHSNWRSHVYVVETVEQALRAVGVVT